MLTAAEARDLLMLEWESRQRAKRRELEPKFDWYGPPCGCPESREDGSCLVHPRARANQRPPEHGGVFVNGPGVPDWENWLILAGRGFGKTRAVCEWLIEQAKNGPKNGRYALVGATASDVRDVIIEGESGILAISPPWFVPEYYPSKSKLVWPNGAMAFTYTSEVPGKFRGPQFHGALCDEAAKWERPDECYDNLQFGMRLGRGEGWIPRAAWSTTPLPIPLIKMLLKDPKTVVSRGSTYENVVNLPESTVERFRRKYEGTRLGRQELHAEVLEDVPGALWKGDQIEKLRATAHPDLVRVVVGVDPSGSTPDPKRSAHAEEKRAEAGIVVAGRSEDDHFWVLEDASISGTPNQWGEAAVEAYHRRLADCLAAETNFGGAMVEAVVRAVDADVSFKNLWASRGKVPRAEPIASLYEQCVAGGSLVATSRGLVPIEGVKVGEEVWTRSGLKRVLWSGQTGVKPTLIVESSGRTLCCTEEHPIYVEGKGFLHAGQLVPGIHRIPVWKNILAPTAPGRSPNPEVDVVLVPPRPGGAPRGSRSENSSSGTASAISSRTTATGGRAGTRAESSFIVPFGNMLTGPYHPTGTSITSTKTRATIASRTSSSSLREITRPSILGSRTTKWSASGFLGRSWIGGSGESPNLASVTNAGPIFRPSRPRSDSARPLAIRATSIDSVKNGPTLPVYNLTVEGQPEFFANGILVHNCRVHHVGTFPELESQMCSYVPGMKSPDRMDALVWALTELQDTAPAFVADHPFKHFRG